MIDTALLALLRCPESKGLLAPASPELIALLEARRAEGALRNRAGNLVTQPIQTGMVRDDGARFYILDTDIPILITGEGIEL